MLFRRALLMLVNTNDKNIRYGKSRCFTRKSFLTTFICHHTLTAMKSIITCLLLLCAYISGAQVTIKDLSNDTVSFPMIQTPQKPEAAKKMNAALKADWGFDAYAKNPWIEYRPVEEASFGYKVGINNGRALSMEIESQYSACGLHITRYDYNFDSRTGAPVDLNKIFGADGQVKLNKALAKTWKATLKAASMDPNESRADEYKTCLVDNEKITAASIERILLVNEGIKFWINGCLEGTAYDFEVDRGHGPHVYSLGQLLPMLTPYGFSLFVDKQTGPTQNLLRGTVDGKYPISLTLLPGKDANSITGMIVYDRVGTPIQVEGTMNGNQITFHEFEKPDEYLSNIEVSWDGAKLTGSFTNVKTKKQMSFEAAGVSAGAPGVGGVK
jgi:hypothetical protein